METESAVSWNADVDVLKFNSSVKKLWQTWTRCTQCTHTSAPPRMSVSMSTSTNMSTSMSMSMSVSTSTCTTNN